jgi:hypothetical protein
MGVEVGDRPEWRGNEPAGISGHGIDVGCWRVVKHW